MPAALDLTGRTFAYLKAIHAVGGGYWHCECACGKTSSVLANRLTSGNTKSCGCLKKSVLGMSTTKHGKAGTRTHRIWKAMRNRCNNPSTPRYKDYGGRGITVCQRWDSFENFLADMGEAPEGKSIDREDNDKGYEPGNCRWATPSEQNENTRASVRVNGKSIKQLAAEQGVTYMEAYDMYRAGRFDMNAD